MAPGPAAAKAAGIIVGRIQHEQIDVVLIILDANPQVQILTARDMVVVGLIAAQSI